MKRGGGRRYYRPDDIDLLRGIRHLLYGEGYTIRGVQRILREQGSKFVQTVWQEGAPQPPHGVVEEEFMDEAENVETEPFEEQHGLRGRLSSLIGRDLGDREDDASARMDPPLTGAPVPRIEPADRAMHGAAETPDVGTDSVTTAPRSASEGLGRDDLRKLQSALHELAECRKLIDAAVTRPH